MLWVLPQLHNLLYSWIIKKSISKERNKTRYKARKKGGNKTRKKRRKKIFDKNLKFDNANGNLPLSKEKVSKIIQTVSSDKSEINLFTNCIDFVEKEEILNKIKTNPEYQPNIEDYISSRFEPNKNINDLIALIQKTIMLY